MAIKLSLKGTSCLLQKYFSTHSLVHSCLLAQGHHKEQEIGSEDFPRYREGIQQSFAESVYRFQIKLNIKHLMFKLLYDRTILAECEQGRPKKRSSLTTALDHGC